MKICGIYKIQSPSNKIYIGASRDILKRWGIHYKYCCNIKAQKKLYNSFMKYGIGNHIFEIIEETDVSILFDREIYWINHYNSFEKGLNLTLGGENPPIQSRPLSQAHREKIGLSNKGKITTVNTRLKISISLTGRKQLQSSIEKRVNKIKGVPSKLKNTKRPNISAKLKGKLSPISIRCKLTNMITNEELIAGSMQELCRISKISIASIIRMRNGETVNKYKNYKYEQY